VSKPNNIIKYILVVLSCVSVAFGSIYISYKSIKDKSSINNLNLDANIGNVLPPIDNKVVPVEDVRIFSTTDMIYEYHYIDDGEIVRNNEKPPYFLMGLSKEELEHKFIDWEIIKFTKKEVVMKKYIEGKSEKHYIIGTKDGFVAVFYENEINGSTLKEITGTLVNTLHNEEQDRLREGIVISGDEKLIKALEDYGS
jgi:hypothetical protein